VAGELGSKRVSAPAWRQRKPLGELRRTSYGWNLRCYTGGTEISETGRWTVWSVKGMEWTVQEEALEAELAYVEKRATGKCGP